MALARLILTGFFTPTDHDPAIAIGAQLMLHVRRATGPRALYWPAYLLPEREISNP